MARRTAYLTDYQDAAYAKRYEDFVTRVRETEKSRTPAHDELTAAVARYYFKLLAVKDEYEVARLYRAREFRSAVEETFEGAYKMRVHLAPPLIARRDPNTGRLEKKSFGPWIFGIFGLLARLKGLRNTPLDVFGYTAERKAERQLVLDYEKTVAELLSELDAENHALAVEIASIPDRIRGFGHVKDASIRKAKSREAELIAAFRSERPVPSAAE